MNDINTKIIPIILSGGAGARLWPVSSRSKPKTFMEVAGKPLLAHALERAALISDEALIVTNQNDYQATETLLETIEKVLTVSYLLEPEGHNTAPAIALAVKHIQKTHGDDAICLVLPADHLISDGESFEKAVYLATKHANAGKLVVFGVRPTAPETGYGYLEVAETHDAPQQLKSFVEKPDRVTAEKYLAEGFYYWNSGMFCFTAGVMSENMATYAGDVWSAAEVVFATANEVNGVTRFDKARFVAQPNISVDFAVMEQAKEIFMVPASFGWSDVGSWETVAKLHQCDVDGNSATGSEKVRFIGSTRTHVESRSNVSKVVVAIGVDNLVVVDTPEALLVADRSKSQDVKFAAQELDVNSNA